MEMLFQPSSPPARTISTVRTQLPAYSLPSFLHNVREEFENLPTSHLCLKPFSASAFAHRKHPQLLSLTVEAAHRLDPKRLLQHHLPPLSIHPGARERRRVLEKREMRTFRYQPYPKHFRPAFPDIFGHTLFCCLKCPLVLLVCRENSNGTSSVRIFSTLVTHSSDPWYFKCPCYNTPHSAQ